ncbi:DUF4184 family protein [Kitasatospora sp. NBC_00374]|uniref:DUF4184 family protein n=1 Tax=Kitasatospora sp. NBC_00374 TaxID=2975964 RepID=UPI00324A2206
MPFTMSHPAAVLPLLRGARARGPLVAAALVAGSMAPDLPFFADSLLPGVYRYGGLTHRWWAVATVDVALASGLVAGWHGLWRDGTAVLLPAAVAGPRRVPARPGWVALSAALGAASHVGWDSFTHPGRAGVRALPALTRTVGGVPLYTVLQYGTSLVGLALVARHATRAAAGAARPVPRPGPGRPAAAAALAVAAAAGAGRRLARRRGGVVDEACFGAGAGAAVALAAVGAVARAGRRRCPDPRWRAGRAGTASGPSGAARQGW